MLREKEMKKKNSKLFVIAVIAILFLIIMLACVDDPGGPSPAVQTATAEGLLEFNNISLTMDAEADIFPAQTATAQAAKP